MAPGKNMYLYCPLKRRHVWGTLKTQPFRERGPANVALKCVCSRTRWPKYIWHHCFIRAHTVCLHVISGLFWSASQKEIMAADKQEKQEPKNHTHVNWIIRSISHRNEYALGLCSICTCWNYPMCFGCNKRAVGIAMKQPESQVRKWAILWNGSFEECSTTISQMGAKYESVCSKNTHSTRDNREGRWSCRWRQTLSCWPNNVGEIDEG